MKYKKGDIITSPQEVDRIIVKVKKKSYLWKYLGLQHEPFDSINSNDPLLEWWKLKE